MHQLVRFLCAGMVQCADTAATLFVYSLSALAAGVGYEARHPQGEMAPQLVPAPRTEPMQNTAAEDAMRAFDHCVYALTLPIWQVQSRTLPVRAGRRVYPRPAVYCSVLYAVRVADCRLRVCVLWPDH